MFRRTLRAPQSSLHWAEVRNNITPGFSYVDYCSWVISFNCPNEFGQKATEFLNEIDRTLAALVFQKDEAKPR